MIERAERIKSMKSVLHSVKGGHELYIESEREGAATSNVDICTLQSTSIMTKSAGNTASNYNPERERGRMHKKGGRE